MNNMEAIMIAEGEQGVESEEEYLAAWQHLVNTGLCWELQGAFGRQASQLIEMKLIKFQTLPEKQAEALP